jgi:mono/diheme cytochrome c family protein
MDVHPAKQAESDRHPIEPPSRPPERVVVLAAIGLVLLCVLWALREDGPPQGPPVALGSAPAMPLSPERIPLTTGEEPIADIFVRAGCPVCHTIPGIPGADGRVGPKLVLGTTGAQRLNDPAYHGEARTIHDYVVESVLEPERFIVPGYPGRTMPAWYGSKLSGLALEKIAAYLEQQTDSGPSH